MIVSDGPPLDPSAEEARGWILDELAKAEYHQSLGVWGRFQDWLSGLFDGRIGGLIGPPRFLLLGLAVLVLAGIAFAVVQVVRREGPGRATSRRSTGDILGGAGRTAAQYRADAARALAAGAYGDAVLAGFRATAAAALERAILTELPGRTADELARSLGPVFPDHASGLSTSARAFDEVRYGGREATREQAEQVLATDAAVASARPRFVHDQVGVPR